jgi:hypothetical protein
MIIISAMTGPTQAAQSWTRKVDDYALAMLPRSLTRMRRRAE